MDQNTHWYESIQSINNRIDPSTNANKIQLVHQFFIITS